MSINIKKYTKDQMAKMVEEAQEKNAALGTEIVELKNCIDAKNDLLAEYANLKAAMQRKNVALVEQISQMNGESINRANEIANLKADADALRNKLADTEAALGRANASLTYSATEKNELQIKLTAAEGALGKMNDKIVRCEAYSRALRGDINKLQWEKINEGIRANYAEAHPWRNLWAWVKRKLVRHD